MKLCAQAIVKISALNDFSIGQEKLHKLNKHVDKLISTESHGEFSSSTFSSVFLTLITVSRNKILFF